MNDLVIVSNRGPFSFSEDFLSRAEDSLKRGTAPEPPSFGEGGLVQAMAGLLKPGKWTPTWIGAAMGDRDFEVARGHYGDLFAEMARKNHSPGNFPHIEIGPDRRMHFRYGEYDFYMRFVFFDTKHMHSYYSKFANGFLWPLMHLTRPPLFYQKAKAFPRPAFVKNDFIQYTSSAVTFANTVSDEVRRGLGREGDFVVWNQDYHLMQIAELYKALLIEEGYSDAERKRIHVGQFMHTPFFDIHEIQGLLRQDKRKKVKSLMFDPFGESMETVLQKITWGMLANDFIGFHTKEYCDNFLEALQEWFPVNIRVFGNYYEISYQNSVTTIGAIPIGLDVDGLLREVRQDGNLAHSPRTESFYEKLSSDRKAGRIVFGGLERCDYTKGLLERMEIFSRTLTGLKEEGKSARFYQVTAPSRSENPDYQHLQILLDEKVESLNRELGGEAIVYLNQGVPVPENYRFMKEVDVMLVTPLEDGMNLVTFEYILSQKYRSPERRGLLVLGSSGASRVLRSRGFGEKDGVVYVNPMRPKDAAMKALEAMKKGLRLSDRLIGYVEKERRVDDWAQRNIEAILNCRKSG